MKIRVVHVVSKLDLGGAETNLYNLLKHFDNETYETSIVVHGYDEGEIESQFKKKGVKIFHLRKYNGLNVRTYQRDFIRILDKLQPDLVHLHIRVESVILSRAIRKNFRNTKIVSHSHSTSEGNGIKGLIKKIHHKNIINYTDKNLSCSKLAGEWMFGCNYDVLYNSIDIESFRFDSKERDNLRKKFDFENKFVIGHVGTFKIVKNHKFMVTLLAELIKINQNFRLVFIGDGSELREIKELSEELGLKDYILFLGNIIEVNRYYNMFDLFLLPSFYEGLPMVLIEAQANGLVSIVSDSITEEINIGSNINHLPLKVNQWVDKIHHMSLGQPPYRRHVCDYKMSRFDSKSNSQVLMRLYERLIEE